jgi:hypothetical protein
VSHLGAEALWNLAAAAPEAEASSHLASCEECRAQLAKVQQAQRVLQLRPVVPPLNPIAARRIGAVLKEAAEQQLKPRGGWFSARWALAGLAAAVLAIWIWNQEQIQPPAPTPVAVREAPPPALPAKVEPPLPVEVPKAPVPKLLAKVTGAKRAKSQSFELLKSQTLTEGAQVKTEPGGALWLQLPDGSRAGLTGASEVQLDTLEDKAVGLSLASGNLVMMARHLPDRMLTVKAGEVEVRDIGTRFLVSRDLSRVLVAVEEGVVEVNAPGSKLTLTAGRSAEWREGRFWEQAWAPPAVEKAKVVSAPSPVAEVVAVDAGSVWRPQNPEDEWASPPNLPKTGLTMAPTPPPVVEGVVPSALPSVDEEEASVLTLAGLEQRLKKVTRLVRAPFAPVGSSMRETRSREIGRLADEGNCDEVLKRAEEWLSDRVTDSSDEPRWKRSVQVNQLRCYNRLHRDADASRLRERLQ